MNAGIEWCEELILEHAGKRFGASLSLEQQLSSILLDTSETTQLLQYLERMEIAPGTSIIIKGEPSEDLFFIESGEVTTSLQDRNDSYLHLETMKNGRVIGDIGFYLGHARTANVTASEQCIIYRLSTKDLRELEKENPAIASLLHQVMVRLLAERVTHLVKTVNALQK